VTRTPTVTHTPVGGPGPSVYSAYFAEGYTGGTFDSYLTLANPNSGPIDVAITFQYADGATGPPGTVMRIEPNQRATLLVNAVAGAGKEVAMGIASDQPFVAERPIYFTAYPAAAGAAYNQPGAAALRNVDGGHLGVPASQPHTTWYFAEGYTGDGFEGYFTIQNPNSTSTPVTLTYYLDDGQVLTRSVTVAANARQTVIIHGRDSQGGIGAGRTFSAQVAAKKPIIVERVTYFRYRGAITGGTATLGANATARIWHFAEGYTGDGFDEYLTIMNPTGAPGFAIITYFVEGEAAPAQRTASLAPFSRTTVRVHEPADPVRNPGGLGRGKAHATRVETTVPTIVERPMYFLYNGPSIRGVDGGHNVMGATSLLTTGRSVVMAEGYTGAGFEQYLTFQNPNPTAATVQVTYLLAAGGTAGPFTVTLPPSQRMTIPVHRAGDPSGAGLGPGQTFATRIDVVDGGTDGILAERVMYFRYAGTATGGTSAFGQLIGGSGQ